MEFMDVEGIILHEKFPISNILRGGRRGGNKYLEICSWVQKTNSSNFMEWGKLVVKSGNGSISFPQIFSGFVHETYKE